MFLRPLRIAQRVALIVAGAMLLTLIAAGVILPTVISAAGGETSTATTSPGVTVLIVVLAIIGIAVLASVGTLMWRGTNLAMNVTTAGIEVHGYLRTQWLPWEQVQVIESSAHWYWRHATCIVTTSGERVLPIVTSYQFLYFRGDPHDAVSRDPRVPQLPTRVAIDAHQRWLRGEFIHAQ